MATAMESFDGRNYRIELADERLLIARLHRRPDLDTSAGADDVERMTETIHAANAGVVCVVRAIATTEQGDNVVVTGRVVDRSELD